MHQYFSFENKYLILSRIFTMIYPRTKATFEFLICSGCRNNAEGLFFLVGQ